MKAKPNGVRKLSPAPGAPRARGVHIVAEVARTGVGGVAQNRNGARRIGSELLRAFGPGPARARWYLAAVSVKKGSYKRGLVQTVRKLPRTCLRGAGVASRRVACGASITVQLRNYSLYQAKRGLLRPESLISR